MGNRTGTYIAFDGLNQTDPTKSDYKYYSTIQAWDKNKHIDFKLTNSHEKTFAVRDTSQKATLEARIRERLSLSKNMVVILSSDTRKSGSMLSYEIEQAVDQYQLPLIIAYVDYQIVAFPGDLENYWPQSLNLRINNTTAKAIHIPFLKDALLDAIGQFSISNRPETSLNYYTKEAHSQFGGVNLAGLFINTLKSTIW